MASALNVVIATERLLTHHDREEHNRLDGAVAANATTVTVEFDPSQIARGTTLGIDWELFEVWSASGRDITVEGAQEGTTAAIHADGALVTVKPKFPRQFILDDINHELDDLSSPINGLWRVGRVDISYDSTIDGYDIGADFLSEEGIIDVSWEPDGTSKTRRYLTPNQYTANTGLDTADFTSGNAIFLKGGRITGDSTVRVRYAAAFTNITTATTDVAATSGIASTALDILHIGAAIRQLDGLEPARNYVDAQGSSRRSQEVPPGASARSTLSLRDTRAKRISAEAARLRQAYPMVLR